MRPVILGMNNPHGGGDPLSPDDGAGRRLRNLLPSLTREEYLSGFERRNLLPGRRWDQRRAMAAGGYLIGELLGSSREVVVLGRDAWRAVCIVEPDLEWFSSVSWCGVTWHLIPHPSGRCLTYNDEEARRAAGEVLLGVYERSIDG